MPMRSRRLAILSSCSGLALAVMTGPALSADYTVTDPSGDPTVENSLGWAIARANANPGADTIAFDSSLAGQTITWESPPPIINTIAKRVTIAAACANDVPFHLQSGGGHRSNDVNRRLTESSQSIVVITQRSLGLYFAAISEHSRHFRIGARLNKA